MRLISTFLIIITIHTSPSMAEEAKAWAALQHEAVVLFRHANAPGTGDPPHMRLTDCETQRNLDETGRRQARRIGELFRLKAITVGSVLSSQWCRTLDTAKLAFPGQVTPEPAFNSFFANPKQEAVQTARAREIIQGWSGPGALVIVTHQVNITALTGHVPASGEGLVIQSNSRGLTVIGRLKP